ncbi:MAG: 5'-3' exonuclease H3TH domain-containing protein [Gammaproteobacteria bacterium]
MAGSARRRLYLIDSSIYIFRAWFSLPAGLTDPRGNPVNAVYGFAVFLTQLLEQARPSHVAALFDESLTTSFRNGLFPGYKANRELPPAELERQLRWCRRLVRAAGVAEYASTRYEADDLIGTLARQMRRRGFSMVYVSRDKDLLQLVQGADRYWDFSAGRVLAAQDVRRELGVRPRQVPDWLALTGDRVDNIPGVPGIGAKTAAALIDRYGSLTRVYDNLERLPVSGLRGAGRLQRLLRDHREQVWLARRLVTIDTGAPLHPTTAGLRWRGPRPRALSRLFNELGFGPGLRQRFAALAPH